MPDCKLLTSCVFLDAKKNNVPGENYYYLLLEWQFVEMGWKHRGMANGQETNARNKISQVCGYINSIWMVFAKYVMCLQNIQSFRAVLKGEFGSKTEETPFADLWTFQASQERGAECPGQHWQHS